MKKWRIAGINFDHFHMGDLLRQASEHPNAEIVGISDYANFGAEIGGDLPGARNDARDFRDVLIAQKGFAAENIHMVLDQEATRDRLVSELSLRAQTADLADLACQLVERIGCGVGRRDQGQRSHT